MHSDLQQVRKLRAERFASAMNRAGRGLDDLVRSILLSFADLLYMAADGLVAIERAWRDEQIPAAQMQLALDGKEGVADATRS